MTDDKDSGAGNGLFAVAAEIRGVWILTGCYTTLDAALKERERAAKKIGVDLTVFALVPVGAKP